MMYQAIVVKYLPPTNTKGSRWKASASAGSLTLSTSQASAMDCATALANRYNWLVHCELVGGTLPDGRDVFVLIERRTK